MAQSIKRSAANPYRTGGPSRYFQTRGGTSSIPTTGIRTGANVSVGGGKGGAPAAKGASAEAPKVPTGVEPGEPSAPEYNPIIDAETMSPPVDPNRQEAILNQARAPRFAIGNPGVGSIDLGSLLSAKPTEGFDPKAPIGGANVPFQETKGVGGYFRRLFGDTANEQNVAAQQAQGAEWREAEKEAQKEERLLNRMREADKPQALRFERQMAANEEENRRRDAREGERLGLTKQQIEDARLDRIERLKGEQADREARIEDMRTRNALADYTIGQNQLKSNQPSMIGLSGGGLGVMDPRSGSISIVNQGTAGFGDKFPGTAPSTRQVYPQPKAPAGSGAQVDRATGNTMGGRLPAEAETDTVVTPPRNPMMPMDESNRPSQRMVPTQEEESIDPYQLQRTTPSMGTMMEPSGTAARRRARYLSPNMPGWSLGQ